MGINFEIADLLKKFELNDRDKKNLAQLFELTKYLYDNEENLTKTMNLIKKARENIIERIEEMFEGELMNDMEDLGEINTGGDE
jgi:hypothetical protein